MNTADEVRKLPNLSVEYAALSDAAWAATQLPKSAAGAEAVLADYAEPQWCPIREHYCRCDPRCEAVAAQALYERTSRRAWKNLDDVRDGLVMRDLARDYLHGIGRTVGRRHFYRAWAGCTSAEIREGGGV